MPRSARNSDDDFDSKAATGRIQTRMSTVHSISSPLRRSSRIKQNKYSPGSESDCSSISNSQTTWNTRTATMDSAVSDTMKKLRTRKLSISSDISEVDVDIPQTPGKRITRQSSGLISTPTKMNTRASSKRLMRAVSETQSPLPVTRTMRKTRASSIGPESLSNQNKSYSDSPIIKTRRRASMLPSSSKERIELEDRIPYVRLDTTIVEADEITSSGNSDSSPDKILYWQKKIKKRQSIDKDEMEDDSCENVETSTDLSKNETLQSLEKKNKMQIEDIGKTTVENTEDTLDKGQYKVEKILSDNNRIGEVSTYSSSSSSDQNSAKEDEIRVVDDICKSTKVLGKVSENVLDTSTEEQKSDKENEILNINSDVSVEKSMQPNVTSSYFKSLVSMNKSLNEKETKAMKKELSKRYHLRESTEIAMKPNDLSKEDADNSQEKMDISLEILNSTTTNETVLSQHDSIELIEVINEDEISIENKNTSINKDATEVSSESDKIDKKEYTVIDNKNSNKIESDKIDKTSYSSISLVKSTQIENKDDDRESFTSILTTDDNNEIKLRTLEEQSLQNRDENEVSNEVVYCKPQLVDLQISPINEDSDARATRVTQDKVLISDCIEEKEEQEQENLSKLRITESTFKFSITILETNNSACDDLNVVIQEDQSDIIETSKKSIIDISPEKTDAKDISLEKTMKQNLKRKSTDVLEKEKESSQMEMSQKDQESMEITDSDIEGDIALFQDIPINKLEEKNDVKTVQSTSQLLREVENDNESESDLILVAETIKAAKEAKPFEYDSDDTVLKSRLDTVQTNYNAKKLDILDEKLMDIDSEKNEKQVKKQKSRTQKRLVSEIDQDSSRYTEDEDNLVTASKSFNESSKTALNRTNDRSISRLNKSEPSISIREYNEYKASNASDKEIEDDASKLNNSLRINKKNTSLRKSVGRRTSLNKSLKDMSMQNVSANKSQIDDSEEELDSIDANIEKKYNKKHSLNKSRNEDADDNVESKTKNISTEGSNKKGQNISLNRSMDQKSKPVDTKSTIYLNDDESDNSDIIATMDFGFKTSSMVANAGSDNSDQDNIPSYLFAKVSSDSDTDDSNSDIKREYNLDGIKLKFLDDDVPADECRTSEVEFSDSDDNGSDLADFIVDDNDVEDMDLDELMKEDDESEDEEEDEVVVREEKVEDKQAHVDVESINTKDENEEDDRKIQKKDFTTDFATSKKEDAKKNKFGGMETISSCASASGKLSKIHKSKNKSIEYISSCKSETEMKQNMRTMESSISRKNEKIVSSNSLNSDLSIKKKKNKSLNDTDILSDTSNIISSLIKKNRKSNPQYSSRTDERDSNEQFNELSPKKLSESCELMEPATAQNNKDQVSDYYLTIVSSDDVIQKHSQKKQKKRKKRLREHMSRENITDETVSENTIELKSPKKKKSVKSTQLTIMDDNIHENVSIGEKKKKKKKKQNTSKENNIEALPEDAVELKIPKKKKLVKPIQLTIMDDNIHENVSIGEKKKKKKKKQNTSKENNIEALSEDAVELKIPKKKKLVRPTQLTIMDDNIHENVSIGEKKKKKKKKQNTSKENNIEVLPEDAVELKIPKKKKLVKHSQLTIIDDNIHEDASINGKKKKKEQDTSKEDIIDEGSLSEDLVELMIPESFQKHAKLIQLPIVESNIREDICQINKKEKKKKQETSKKNITEVLSEDVVESKIPKKKKRVKFNQLAIVEDDTCKSAYEIYEKEKKKKKGKVMVEKALPEDTGELKISKKKKCSNLNQVIVQHIPEDVYQINKKEKKKKKQINVAEKDENVNKDKIRKSIHKNKTELAQQKKNKIINNLELDSPVNKGIIKKKTKQQETMESTETLQTEKKSTLRVQIPVSKLKSDKNLLTRKLQKTVLDKSEESKNVVRSTKKLDEATEKMYTKELKPRKKRARTEDIENAPTKKSKKEIKEMNKFLPTSGLKRLSDDVIENLTNVPTSAKKRRKISQNKDRVMSSVKTDKSKMTADCNNSFTLSTSGSTQFHVLNLQNTKKQLSKGAAAAALFRQRMLARNNREPISAYMIYRDEMNFIK